MDAALALAYRDRKLMRWVAGPSPPAFDAGTISACVARLREPAYLVRDRDGRAGVAFGGRCETHESASQRATPSGNSFPLTGILAPMYPEWLAGRAFTAAHGVRFPYVAGEMANGLSTPRLVIAMARAGMLAFFGAAGLTLSQVAAGITQIESALAASAAPWGTNLIHSPGEPELEAAVAEHYLARGIRHISVSAFMALTPAVVRCAATGLGRDPAGRITRRHQLFAKLSRPELAAAFMAPAPLPLLEALLRQGQLTRQEVELAQQVPVAEDITVEADSGGHTDNRPLGALFPVILALRDELMRRHGFQSAIRVGAAGGLGTPSALAAAFALGAAYVLTGSVNQSAVESGLSSTGKAALAQARLSDVMMAPAADMFELGIKVQVLKHRTLFGVRAARLYELYRRYESLDALPSDVRRRLEQEVLRASCEDVWARVQHYFAERDPEQLRRAEREPKHLMALVFRWYLGSASHWAIEGNDERQRDYQIWCGPAMGAFNDWVKGSFLEAPENRSVVQIALNLLEGAAVVTRAQQLRVMGVPVPEAAFQFAPRPLE
jgi:trans-AT polyketide synthase, acyltransferase and oxidoreductase domains